MPWRPYYHGDGVLHDVELPQPPPWRRFPLRPIGTLFQPPHGLIEAVNAALHLRRPLLLTGAPGSGKSTVIQSVATELNLGRPLRWHITSRSALSDALYRYDVLGRVHAQQLTHDGSDDDITAFLQLGPLGTALLPSERPRALLIDEFDKSDFDLPGDLLDVLEHGEFEIQELARYRQSTVMIREWESDRRHPVQRGRVSCTTFPFIVITSNGERDFPPPFLRRCVRFTTPAPTAAFLRQVVSAHLGSDVSGSDTSEELIHTFLERLQAGEALAVDQLLNAVFLLTGESSPEGARRSALIELLLRELSRA